MNTRNLSLLLAVLFAAGIWGCGSNQDSSGSTTPTVSVENAAQTGNCTICHTLGVHTQISGIAGQNPDTDAGFGSAITHDCEACHGGGQYHHGEGPIPYPSPDAARCVTCHEQATAVLASKHNAEDPANTAMIADGHDTRYCQRCHTAEGSIAMKNIIGDYDYLRATIVANGDPVGAGQVEALPNTDAAGNDILHNVTCAACHNPLTKKLVSFDPADWDPNGNGISDQFDLCTSCHNYRFSDGTLAGSGNTYSVSVDAGVDGIWLNGDDTLSAGTDTAKFYHYKSWYRAIPSTHFDNPDSPSVVEGYVIRENGANPCFDCHGHELHTNTRYADTTDLTRDATATIYTDWAQSAHAGALLKNKYAVARVDGVNASDSAALTDTVMSVGATDTATGNAWVHYNWDDNASRGACQMCHTATGAANFMSDPASYLAADNDFSHLSGWSAAGGSPQNELLNCWGCHSNAAEGILRTPGAITVAYGNRPVLESGADLTADPVEISLPDLGNSNVCINCHSARGNMTSLLTVDDDNDSATPLVTVAADPAALTMNKGSILKGGTSTHYLTAGATIFQSLTKVGYEFGGDYSDKVYFAHDSLGCAECHMSSEKSHSFDVVEKDETDVITAIASPKCVECHDGEHALFVAESLVGQVATIWNGTAAVPTTVTQVMADEAAAELEHEAHGYHTALEALAAELTLAGTTPTSGYPYFSGSSTDQGHGGAMHNYSYLHHEPGAYAHNRYYAKRLIFDSIDWLSSGAAGARSLDGSITLDPVLYGAAIEWLGGDIVTGVIAARP
jgi:formate-dependent nitrite reductase cytochrome c552 subunit